jgi:hypothetical protein
VKSANPKRGVLVTAAGGPDDDDAYDVMKATPSDMVAHAAVISPGRRSPPPYHPQSTGVKVGLSPPGVSDLVTRMYHTGCHWLVF